MEESPGILKEEIGGQPFITSILTPHRCYYNCLRDLFGKEELAGLAHITGGGIQENLNRILPDTLNAEIHLEKIRILPIFKTLKQFGALEDADMLRTFNMGVGMTAVIKRSIYGRGYCALQTVRHRRLPDRVITKGNKQVDFIGELQWE